MGGFEDGGGENEDTWVVACRGGCDGKSEHIKKIRYIMQLKQLGIAWWGHNWRMSNTSGVMTGEISVIYICIH